MIKDTRFRDTLNFRQLGGYMTAEGRTVKENVFYRSGAPFRMNESELEALKQLGLYAIMDLRSNEEISQRPDPELPNILMIKHSGAVSEGGEEINFSTEGMNRIGEGGREQLALLKKYYARMPFNNQAFRIMFEHIRGFYRIEKIEVNVDENDSEEVTLTFDNLSVDDIIAQQEENE